MDNEIEKLNVFDLTQGITDDWKPSMHQNINGFIISSIDEIPAFKE